MCLLVPKGSIWVRDCVYADPTSTPHRALFSSRFRPCLSLLSLQRRPVTASFLQTIPDWNLLPSHWVFSNRSACFARLAETDAIRCLLLIPSDLLTFRANTKQDDVFMFLYPRVMHVTTSESSCIEIAPLTSWQTDGKKSNNYVKMSTCWIMKMHNRRKMKRTHRTV